MRIMRRFSDLTGQEFGRLFVLERAENNKWGNLRWLCQCNYLAKKKIIVHGSDLKKGHTKSCGCLQKEKLIERSTKHGCTKNKEKTREYISWTNMIQRCTNSNHPRWEDYGGRGITVCEEWMKFANFLEDMGERPNGKSIERVKNSLGYFKENCKWATPREQNRNSRHNCYVIYQGKRWLFVELCEKHNMPRKVVYGRYYHYGWTLKEALTILVGQYRNK